MTVVQRWRVQQVAVVRIDEAEIPLAPLLILCALGLRQDAGLACLGSARGGVEVVRLAADSVHCRVDGPSEGLVEVEALVVEEAGAGGGAEEVLELLGRQTGAGWVAVGPGRNFYFGGGGCVGETSAEGEEGCTY